MKSVRGYARKRYELPNIRTGIRMMSTANDDSYLLHTVGLSFVLDIRSAAHSLEGRKEAGPSNCYHVSGKNAYGREI